MNIMNTIGNIISGVITSGWTGKTLRCVRDFKTEEYSSHTVHRGEIFDLKKLGSKMYINVSTDYDLDDPINFEVNGEKVFEVLPEDFFDTYLGYGDEVYSTYISLTELPRSINSLEPVGVVQCIKNLLVEDMASDIENRSRREYHKGNYYYLYNIKGTFMVEALIDYFSKPCFIPITRSHFKVITDLKSVPQQIASRLGIAPSLSVSPYEITSLQSNKKVKIGTVTCIKEFKYQSKEGLITVQVGSKLDLLAVNMHEMAIFRPVVHLGSTYHWVDPERFTLDPPAFLVNMTAADEIQAFGSSNIGGEVESSVQEEEEANIY